MVIINPNEIVDIGTTRENIEWKCAICQKIYNEERRNYTRRKIKCICQKNLKRFKEMNKELENSKYIFLYNESNSCSFTKNGSIDTKKKILVKCLNCGKQSYEYYQNIRKGHKKCNCSVLKKFTRDCSTEEFLEKWHFLNKKNFSLCENEKYKNRNTKYKIKCNNCQKEDFRWGISLIDGPILCKYCNIGSKYELFISHILSKMNIKYIREYPITVDNKHYRFDFYLPEYDYIIEYNGEQHYHIVEYFGGEESFIKTQLSDKIKKKYCEENNFKLKVFSYKETEEDISNWLSTMFNDYPEREYPISD